MADDLLSMIYNPGSDQEGGATDKASAGGGNSAPQATPAPTPSSDTPPASGPVPPAPPAISDGPENRSWGTADYLKDEASQIWKYAKDTAGAAAEATSLSGGLTDYGIDSAYMDKMDRTRQLAEKLAKFRRLAPEQQAKLLSDAGLEPADMASAITATGKDLKEQQEQMRQVSAAAGESAKQTEQEIQQVGPRFNTGGNIAVQTAMLGMYPAAAAEYFGVTDTAGITAEIAKSWILNEIAGFGAQQAVRGVHKVFPNAGPATDALTEFVAGMFSGVIGGHALEGPGGASWLDRPIKEEPVVNAAVADTHQTYQDPIGMKDPYEDYIVSKESIARDKEVAQLKQAAAQRNPDELYETEYQGAIPQPPEGTSKSGAPRLAEPEPPPEPEKAPGERENLPPGEVPEHLKAEAPDEGPTTERGIKYEERGPTQHIRQELGKSVWETFKAKLRANDRGSISTAELTDEQKEAIRRSFGEWAIPIISGAQRAGDTDTLEKFSGLLKPEDEKAFNIPPEPQKLVSASDRAAKVKESAAAANPPAAKPVEPGPTEGAAPPAEKPPAEEPEVVAPLKTKSQKAALKAAYAALLEKQGEMHDKLGLADNEDTANEAIKRKPSEPLDNVDMARYQAAAKQSLENIQKLAAEHLDAAAHNDNERVGTVADLFQHETAKLAYLQHATGESTEDIAQQVAKATSQSSDILREVGALKGTKAEQIGKTAAIMGWQHYLDPANIAVSATLWNPPLWAGKAVTDSVWLTYNNAVKGLSYALSAHPEDAVQMWAGSLKGVLESIGDAVRYSGEAFKFGNRAAEINLGMMKGENNTSTTLFDDYADTNAGEAIQYMADVYSSGVAGKVKQVAGMTLNAGPRVILAEDQFAKTFAFRAAARTAALARAITEANEKGLWGGDRWEYVKSRGEQLVNDMPDDLVKQASDEAYAHTFTSYNKTASAVQRALEVATVPAGEVTVGPVTLKSPEMHIGRLIGGLYVTTPMNLMKEGFLNSPLALMMPREAGLIGGDLASTRLAMTKMAAGTALMVYMYEKAGQFHLTGSGDSLLPEQRRMRADLGIPNYSIGVPGTNTYVSYERLGPISIPLQFAANMAEIHGIASAANKGEYWKQATAAFAQVLNHGPLMHMFPNIFHALANAGMGNTDELQQYLTESATSVIRPAVVKEITQALDPVMRQAQDNIQRIAMDSPFFRANIPLKRDHWGNPQYVPPSYERDEIPDNPLWAWAYVMSPLHQRPIPKIDDVDAELVRVGANLKPVDKMFLGSAGPTGLRADPENPTVGVPYHPTDAVEDARLKDRLEVLTGHETLIRGVNQHDYMMHEINTPYYKSHDTPNHVWQKERLESIHEMFYARARQELMKEPNGLKERVRQRQAEQRTELMGPRRSTSIGAP